MYLDAAGEFYRLTWKGAALGAWRSIWPISAIRNFMMETKSQSVLRSQGVAQMRST